MKSTRLPGALEFGRGHAIDWAACGGERNERGRYVELFEGARHGVLAADRAHFSIDLRHERAEHGRNRLTPTRGLFTKAFEVFLERIVGVLALEARSHKLRERFDDREVGAIELVRLGKIRVEAPGHA